MVVVEKVGKKFLREIDLLENQLIYPSPSNPRLKGLTAKETSIQSLAESIRKDGQLQPIIVEEKGSKFETVDGDRRAVAIFKILKLPTIKAHIYKLSPSEALRLRLVANIVREDFSPIEKGKYCRQLFDLLAMEDKLDPDNAWSDRMTKSKYLSTISAELGVTASTIINWTRLWNSYSPLAQKLIAGNKEDLRRGLIAPSYALDVASLARAINGNADDILKTAVTERWPAHSIRELTRQVKKDALMVHVSVLPSFIEKIRNTTTNRSLLLDRPTLTEFSAYAKQRKVKIDDLVIFAMQFCLRYRSDFEKFVALCLGGKKL